MTNQTHELALPVTTERNGILGKVFLHDDHGNWIADLSSKYAGEVAAKLNDAPRLRRENEALREALKDLEAIASMVSGLMTLHGQVSPEKWHSLAIETEHARAALSQAEPGDAQIRESLPRTFQL